VYLCERDKANLSCVSATGMMESIFPAIWSFQLALRACGLGSCLTSLHLAHEKETAELLGIPVDVSQVALLPVAYTKGTDFKRANRPDPSTVIHYDEW
jgi:nitroreductase